MSRRVNGREEEGGGRGRAAGQGGSEGHGGWFRRHGSRGKVLQVEARVEGEKKWEAMVVMVYEASGVEGSCPVSRREADSRFHACSLSVLLRFTVAIYFSLIHTAMVFSLCVLL